ncbi:hypothetical protein B7P43_G09282 [Cryptotermes secundus]|uniref:Uncharacterized protein n=1 Tax=Cryptotermes secundus TaxID=105785 RepID=A0A2J7Q5Y4_9NEOP|nr:hypothetical protein B7P43_G09282 [Cryptotermes secundus]
MGSFLLIPASFSGETISDSFKHRLFFDDIVSLLSFPFSLVLISFPFPVSPFIDSSVFTGISFTTDSISLSDFSSFFSPGFPPGIGAYFEVVSTDVLGDSSFFASSFVIPLLDKISTFSVNFSCPFSGDSTISVAFFPICSSLSCSFFGDSFSLSSLYFPSFPDALLSSVVLFKGSSFHSVSLNSSFPSEFLVSPSVVIMVSNFMFPESCDSGITGLLAVCTPLIADPRIIPSTTTSSDDDDMASGGLTMTTSLSSSSSSLPAPSAWPFFRPWAGFIATPFMTLLNSGFWIIS